MINRIMCLILNCKLIFIVLILIGQIFAQDDMRSFTTTFTEKTTVLSSSTSEAEATIITPALKTVSPTTSLDSSTHIAAMEDFTTLKDTFPHALDFETTHHPSETEASTWSDTNEFSEFLGEDSNPPETTTVLATTPVTLIIGTTLTHSPTELSISSVTTDHTTITTTEMSTTKAETTTEMSTINAETTTEMSTTKAETATPILTSGTLTTITTAHPFTLNEKSTQAMNTTSVSVIPNPNSLTSYNSTDILSNQTRHIYINPDDVEDDNIVQVHFNTKDFKIYAWTHGLDELFLTKMTEKLNSNLNQTLNTENVLLVRPSLLVEETVTCFQFAINSSQGIIPGRSVYQALLNSRKELELSPSFKIVKITQGTRSDYYHISSLIMFVMLTLFVFFLIGFILLLFLYLRSKSEFINFQLNHHHHHKHQLGSNSSPKSSHTFTEMDFNSGAVILKEGNYFNDNQRQHDGWVKPYNDPVSNTANCNPMSSSVIDTHL